jgi:transglutaminase-like putative cysteine protease
MAEPAAMHYLDTAGIDWSSVRSATFEVQQTLRYEYPGPIEDVHQILVLVPPDELPGQRLLSHELRVIPEARPRFSADAFGNRICQVALPRVEGQLAFDLRLRVERRRAPGAPLLSESEERAFRLPSPLTEATPALRRAADQLAAGAESPAQLAERINTWVYQRLKYTPGTTDIHSTAQDALSQGSGVCQDFAHLMIAVCRLAGLPARYVSGHLLGEGAMHAWTQVLLPSGETSDPAPLWHPFDPTHGRRAGLPYITIAVGRDFGDVSPTRGSFRAHYPGQLAGSHKHAGVLAIA